ncbi:purine/pyrimidine permease [Tumebacillus permanentifrigoris]|uniref:Xanthine/uracil permease n=1 Tax=Tumebacillus permanentifrigoris TaxID=378543 RepID=A0A316DF53_9BACL|nr:purine/pyrimidine permease [Tumebacillus permanentifrigoris]PWK15819.1 xanthine/uracil permease [Tumebacillus permanentifrigoris]
MSEPKSHSDQALREPAPRGTMLWLQSVQWMVFLLANTIAAPIVVGAAFDLPAGDVSSLVQRILLVSGGMTLLQVLVGHRLPLIEGAAGMWWALFLTLAAVATGGDKGAVLRQLEMGMIIAGVVLVLLSLLPLMGRLRDLFTPLVTGVYLILLVVSLSGSFFKGMLGITRTGGIDGTVVLMSLGVILIVLMLSLKGRGLWRSMGPLIGIVIGWALFAAFGYLDREATGEATHWFALPQLFAWGTPIWDTGIVLTSVLTGVILISNVVASILVVARTLGQEISSDTYRRGLRGNGIGSVLSGMFATIGPVPLSVSAGFISTTGIRSKRPFLIGATMVALSGLFPIIGDFFATLPSEVAYAALFVPFAQMMGFGIRDLMSLEPSPRNLQVIGFSLMVGIGVMFLPPSAIATLDPWLRNLVANGILVGLLLCLFLEHVVFRERVKNPASE